MSKPAEGWYRCPNALVRTPAGKKLTVYAVAVYNVIAMYANGDGRAWPTQATIAGYFGLSRLTVRTCLRELEECGLIKTIRTGKRGRCKYQLTAPFYRQEWSASDHFDGQPVTTIKTHIKTKEKTTLARAPPDARDAPAL